MNRYTTRPRTCSVVPEDAPTRDVSFNADRFTSSDILALVVAAVSDYFDRIRLTNRTYHFAAEFAEVGG
jgi:hypothetical protein